MKNQFKSANINSPGLISTFILLMVLSGFLYFAAFNVLRNDGSTFLLIVLLILGSIGPLISYLHLKSVIIIDGNKLIKKSIFRTKTILISDFQGLFITDTVASRIPIINTLDKVTAKTERWSNLFTIRQINLTKDKNFKPYSFDNYKKIVTLPYYKDLYEILDEKIKNSPQHEAKTNAE